jgi:hypothetical protein
MQIYHLGENYNGQVILNQTTFQFSSKIAELAVDYLDNNGRSTSAEILQRIGPQIPYSFDTLKKTWRFISRDLSNRAIIQSIQKWIKKVYKIQIKYCKKDL